MAQQVPKLRPPDSLLKSMHNRLVFVRLAEMLVHRNHTEHCTVLPKVQLQNAGMPETRNWTDFGDRLKLLKHGCPDAMMKALDCEQLLHQKMASLAGPAEFSTSAAPL
jgi:hypothetical protein